MYEVYYTRKAKKDFELYKNHCALQEKVFKIIQILEKNPLQSPPQYEKLKGNMSGAYSRRINIQHRLVYTVDEKAKEVVVHSLWTHYDF